MTRHPDAFIVLGLCATALLASCSRFDSSATLQTAARVNKAEITVQQINFVLEQQPSRVENAEAARKEALERLIDQELAVQKGEELRLDREPGVAQALEAARRQVIAKAYAGRIAAAAARPDARAVEAYFAQNPALFRERRIYDLQEVSLSDKPEQMRDLQARLQASASAVAFVESLRRGGTEVTVNRVTRPAEQIPLSLLGRLARLEEGQGLLSLSSAGVLLTIVMASRPEPIDFERARPAISRFLLGEQRRKLVETELKAMRAGAQIEYKGRFAAGGTREALTATGAATQSTSATPATPATPALAAPPTDAVQPVRATQAQVNLLSESLPRK